MPWGKRRKTNRNRKKATDYPANHELKSFKTLQATGLGLTLLQ